METWTQCSPGLLLLVTLRACCIYRQAAYPDAQQILAGRWNDCFTHFQLLKLKKHKTKLWHSNSLFHFVWDDLFSVSGAELIPCTHWASAANCVTSCSPSPLCSSVTRPLSLPARIEFALSSWCSCTFPCVGGITTRPDGKSVKMWRWLCVLVLLSPLFSSVLGWC